MDSSKICFVDDSVSGVGGTSLTLEAIVEPNKDNIDFIPTVDFSLNQVFKKYSMYILGNITHFSKNSLDAIIYLMEENAENQKILKFKKHNSNIYINHQQIFLSVNVLRRNLAPMLG